MKSGRRWDEPQTPKYRCPFCKTEIADGIDNLIVHRKPGGECDQNYEALVAEREKGKR